MATNNLLAAVMNLGTPLQGEGPLGVGGSGSATVFTKFVSGVIGILTVVAAMWFIFQLLSGAITWIGAAGDKGKLEEARGRMTSGVIGLVIVVIAIFLIRLIGVILGFSNILDPGAFITNYSFK